MDMLGILSCRTSMVCILIQYTDEYLDMRIMALQPLRRE